MTSEEVYRLAQRAARIGSWDWDILSDKLHWSEMIDPLFGFEPGKFEGTYEAFLECVHPEDRAFVKESVRAAVEDNAEYAIEHRIVWPDSTTRWVSEKGEVHRTSDNQPIRMVGVVQDITDLVQSTAQLQKLSQAVEQSPSTVVITDVQGNIEYVNPKFTALTGYALAEVQGKNPRLLKSGNQPPEFYDAIYRTIFAGTTWHGEFANRKKDGQIYWERASISAVRDNQGEICSLIKVAEDITREKQLEEEVEQLRREYEAFMRHELKNLLFPIRLHSEVLLREAGSSKCPEQMHVALQNISSQVEKTTRLIDKLKLLQDFEQGQYPLHKQVYDLQEVISPAIRDLQSMFKGKGVAFEVHNDGNDYPLLMDSELLHNVFINLLKNAGEHVQDLENEEEKTVRIDITSEQSDLVVKINNMGRPVPEPQLRTFFEKFNTGPVKRGQGTGLGTTYASLVTKAHDGQISVTSDEEQGTTVTLVFPRAVQAR